MRWGSWYKHDASRVQHVKLGLMATLADLSTPSTVVCFVYRHADKLSAVDCADLMICANELVWLTFDMRGLGDWVDEHGEQCGKVVNASA